METATPALQSYIRKMSAPSTGEIFMSIGFPGGSEGKPSACSAGDLGLIPGSGRSAGERNGNLPQYSCLENSTDSGAWEATVHGITKSHTWLRNFTLCPYTCVHMHMSNVYVHLSFWKSITPLPPLTRWVLKSQSRKEGEKHIFLSKKNQLHIKYELFLGVNFFNGLKAWPLQTSNV